MGMWIVILLVAIVMLGAGVVYMTVCFSRFSLIKKLAGESKKKEKIFGLLCVAILGTALCLVFSLVNAVIVIVNLMLFFIIANIIAFAVRKALGKERRLYIEGGIALILCAVYLCVGYFLANNVWEKNYTLSTDKSTGNIRIIQLADSHIGTTFDGKGLGKYVDEMNEKDPDIVVITGDFVDDGTMKQDMIDACAALGRLKTKQGVYFCFGNHDKGYYSNEQRGYTKDDLEAELEKNGVTVLEDELVFLDNNVCIIGRADKSEELENRNGSRKSIAELMQGVDKSAYTVVLDHQPNDYTAEAEAGADLVLSGHTHGGQMLPINRIGELIGANDYTYGHKTIDSTDFIVTSGISDWEIAFKTGCKSEYVVIDIEGK